MGLSGHEIDQLRRAATLHDVGKIRIPDRVLRKPGLLDRGERDIIQEHPSLGAEMVTGAAPQAVALAIRHHHERWDGAGYPDRLRSDEIPLFSRIICVADAYDAMTSARPYKPGCDRKTAIENLRTNAGYQFDPDVVEAFIKTLPAALPAAGALLFLAGPAPLLRKVSAWIKTSGAGSVASAAGATSAAIIVGAAGVTGIGVHHRHPVPIAAKAEAVVAESATADYHLNDVARVAVSLADAQAAAVSHKDADARKQAGDGHRSGHNKTQRLGSTSASARSGSASTQKGSSKADHSTGKAKHGVGAKNDGSNGAGDGPSPATDEAKDSNAVFDPHPHKGNDCEKEHQQDGAHCDRGSRRVDR
jgi:hypothetical protein